MIKSDRIKEYNNLNSGYHITGIKSMTVDQLESYKKYNNHNDIYSFYARPSQYKINSWNDILRDYNPVEIISIQGNSQTYSVILKAANGDILHITKWNNYLIELV